jgi:lysozyme
VTERQLLVEQLIDHEALRLKPYYDTAGKITIGVGRNLSDKGLTDQEAFALLGHDIDECINDLATFAWFAALDSVRQRAVIDFRFNRGAAGFRDFRHFVHYMAIGDFLKAAGALRDSPWYGQVKRRGVRLARMIETGQD